MGNDELVKALGSAVGGGVVSGTLLLILYKVGSKIIERLIAAIDRLATNVADVREAVVRTEAKFDSVLDQHERTPVEIPLPAQPHAHPRRIEDTPSERSRKNRAAARTPPHLQASGYRAPTRGGHDDNDT